MKVDCNGDLEIKTQEDFDQLKTCRIYTGNIVVDRTGIVEMSLRGVELLEGNLVIHSNEALQKVDLPNMQAINGQLRMSNNKILRSVLMPSLSILRQFEISVHPNLKELSFPAGLHQIEQFSVTDTTLTSIEGMSMPRIKTLTITNNKYLKQFSAPNLNRIMSSVTISANSPSLVVGFDKLQELDVGTFRNLAGVSLKGLTMVSGDISFVSNGFDKLSLPAMKRVVGTLTLSDNKKLKQLSVPELAFLGGALSVVSNLELTSIDAFPKLEEIDGSLDVAGAFHELRFPVLADASESIQCL
ncbi:hypothetical protein DM01DRAFT_1296262 [Hesseltinella vesiculosa]|uniref:L domain-like protein n=1 Tax=Hesseltinella vesiculosa TaxID=101127 RepID=A0A1X2G2H9_9FUNG|nr:hypothetical protein DM01DRAFT_1296262 [Hesseltinella vesiculosa]